MLPERVAYLTLLRILRGVAPLLGRGGSKTARALAGRRHAARSLAAWGAGRDPASAAVWFHAPSAGEALQAGAVMEALGSRRGDARFVFTHFSPSAAATARGLPAEWAGYLPWDLPEEVAPVLDLVRPGLLAFTRTEVWPVLAEEATARGVPVALVAAVLAPGARRRGRTARRLLGPTWRSLSLAACVGEEDAQGLAELGVRSSALHVTGDPGIDAAAARARSADPGEPWLRPFAEVVRPTVVAGSTWPSDLRVVLPAMEAVRTKVPDVRLVVAPHEPTGGAVRTLVEDFSRRGWRACSLAEAEERGAHDVDAVVVERVGVLAQLYGVARAAYVGGGFHRAGLHSVVEPAAAGVPVTFGPGHEGQRAAGHLLAAGAGRVAAGAGALAESLTDWLTDERSRVYAASAALGYIDAHRGAAERTAILLDGMFPPPTASS